MDPSQASSAILSPLPPHVWQLFQLFKVMCNNIGWTSSFLMRFAQLFQQMKILTLSFEMSHITQIRLSRQLNTGPDVANGRNERKCSVTQICFTLLLAHPVPVCSTQTCAGPSESLDKCYHGKGRWRSLDSSSFISFLVWLNVFAPKPLRKFSVSPGLRPSPSVLHYLAWGVLLRKVDGATFYRLHDPTAVQCCQQKRPLRLGRQGGGVERSIMGEDSTRDSRLSTLAQPQ